MKGLVEELLIFSDLHAHNFKYGSTKISRVGGIFNSRLLDTIAVLDEIKDYAVAHKIETLLFGGDLFHRRQLLSTDTFNLVFQKFVEMSSMGLTILMIPGNHDYADRVGMVHALQLFDTVENIQVSSRCIIPMRTASCNINVLPVPYSPDHNGAQEQLRLAGELADDLPRPTILLSHLGMQGARVGSNYVLVSSNDITVKDVPFQSFTACFFGHYHEHQQLFSNGWYIGATHEHNWGDSGGSRGFLHARVYKNGIEFNQIITSAPKFVAMDANNIVPAAKDFIRVYADSLSDSIKKRVQAQLGRADFEFVLRIDKADAVLTLKPGQLDPETAMAEWVKTNTLDGIDSAALLGEGLTVLQEARREDL